MMMEDMNISYWLRVIFIGTYLIALVSGNNLAIKITATLVIIFLSINLIYYTYTKYKYRKSNKN